MIRIKTRSGSVWQIDTVTKQIRRHGAAGITARADGEWRTYEALGPLKMGKPLLIRWPDAVPRLPGSCPDSIPYTVTSDIIELERTS